MSATPTEGSAFAELGLRPELVAGLSALGYEEPTPIQQAAIPVMLSGADVLGQAATGTGKTAAFALPMLQRLGAGRPGGAPRALVLVPTRELAVQVSEAVHRYGRTLGVEVTPLYGGQLIARQLHALARGVDVVVATPGRALDHIARRTLRLDEVEVVVLDEADEILDMGFSEDVESILGGLPAERQTVLFSATMPGRITGIARRHQRDPQRLQIGAVATPEGEAPQLRQCAYLVSRAHKPAALGRILDIEAPAAALVFCRTRVEVDQLTETLNGRGYRAEALHGGMSQDQRDRVMRRLRSGATELLVATDVAARGLDVDVLTHVVNYDVPSAPEAYVHRVGRVGRAGREGVAVTLAEPREHRLLKNIEAVMGQRISVEKVPTVADLRTRRMDVLQGTLRESILTDDLDGFRVVVESLTDEFDLVQVTLAALKLAAEASGGPADTEEIPEPVLRPDRPSRPASTGPSGSTRPSGKGRRLTGPTTTLFVGAGRHAGIRPQDLVGAITGESHLRGSDIGSIQIAERFSLVEVPEGDADRVITALRGTTIKGKKANVRRERDGQR